MSFSFLVQYDDLKPDCTSTTAKLHVKLFEKAQMLMCGSGQPHFVCMCAYVKYGTRCRQVLLPPAYSAHTFEPQ